MYIALASKPMPKCFNFLLAILLFNIACALIYVYIVMRKITSSSERFEIIPCYTVALLLFISGIFSLISTRVHLRGRKCLVHCNIGLFLATCVIAVIAMSATMWLADVADSFSVCVYNKHSFMCLCRYNTSSTLPVMYEDWFSYNDIAGCHKLDQLSRCMTAALILNAAGGFVCLVGVVNFFMVLKQLNKPRVEGQANSLTSGQATQTTYGGSGDWDAWLFSHPSFRQNFVDANGSPCLPPTYDETVRQVHVQQNEVGNSPTQGQGSSTDGQRSASPAPVPRPDEPPPPYDSNTTGHSSKQRVKRYQAPPQMICSSTSFLN